VRERGLDVEGGGGEAPGRTGAAAWQPRLRRAAGAGRARTRRVADAAQARERRRGGDAACSALSVVVAPGRR
jgi:hypothetical protein